MPLLAAVVALLQAPPIPAAAAAGAAVEDLAEADDAAFVAAAAGGDLAAAWFARAGYAGRDGAARTCALVERFVDQAVRAGGVQPGETELTPCVRGVCRGGQDFADETAQLRWLAQLEAALHAYHWLLSAGFAARSGALRVSPPGLQLLSLTGLCVLHAVDLVDPGRAAGVELFAHGASKVWGAVARFLEPPGRTPLDPDPTPAAVDAVHRCRGRAAWPVARVGGTDHRELLSFGSAAVHVATHLLYFVTELAANPPPVRFVPLCFIISPRCAVFRMP